MRIRDTFLVFGSPLIGEEEIAEIVDTLRSGWLGTGPKTKRFETEFAAYARAQHAVGVNSCTAALHTALDVLGLGPGDEVIVPAITFAATANVVVHRGATPVFVDVLPDTMNIDPAAAGAACTARTRAMIPVHMAGLPCDLDAIHAIARARDLWVIEDAAHATETIYRGHKVGALSDMTAFSFYVTKNVVTGEGGMLTTNNSAWADEVRIRTLHGISKDAWKRYTAEGFQPYETLYPGYKYNMTDMQASLGIHQLRRVEQNLTVRERIWRRYSEAFAEWPELIVPPEAASGDRHARHLYPLLLDIARLSIDRNAFVAELHRRHIGSGVHFVALHLHRFYRETYRLHRGLFPNAEWISDRTVSLPLSARLTDQDVDDVIAAVQDVVASHRRVLVSVSPNQQVNHRERD